MLESDAKKLQSSERKGFKYEGLALLVAWGMNRPGICGGSNL